MEQNSPNYKMTDFYLAIILAIIVVVVTYLLTKKLKKGVSIVLLTGLSDAGKTALFTKVVYNRTKKSVTSLKENEGRLDDLNLQLIDLPGADRLRDRYWEQYRNKARSVVFVIDSTTIEDKIRELSEYLYNLLSDGIIYRNKIQFIIACHKQDLNNSKKAAYIKPFIEKELNAVKATKTGQLGKTSNEEDEDYIKKLNLKEITFDKLGVNVIETSSKDTSQLMKLII